MALTAANSFEIMLIDTGKQEAMWIAPYAREITPGVGWVGGDRAGYRCAYMFLLKGGTPVGRVTFIRVDGAATYTMVNDERMEEGARYFDGTVAPEGSPNELKQCPESTVAYEPYDGPDQRPIITFAMRRSGVPLEIRDYTKTVAAPGVTFRLLSESPQESVVVAYKDGLPAVAVYYTRLVPSVVVRTVLG